MEFNFGTGAAAIEIVTNTTDTSISLSYSDLGKAFVIDNEDSVLVTLPEIVSSAYISKTIEIQKRGSGAVTISGSGFDTILTLYDSISNTVSGEMYSMLRLKVDSSSNWGNDSMFGTWIPN